MFLYIIYVRFILFYFFLFRLVDESVGWLYSQGRKDEAKAILEKSLKVNKMEAEVKEGEMETLFTAPKETQSYGLLDLLKTPRMRLRTINMCFNW